MPPRTMRIRREARDKGESSGIRDERGRGEGISPRVGVAWGDESDCLSGAPDFHDDVGEGEVDIMENLEAVEEVVG